MSNDPQINPTLDQHIKLATYYCSQDFYLGSGVRVNGILRDGDAYFQGVLDYFVKQHEEWLSVSQQDEEPEMGQLVVAGISDAGSLGVLNHLNAI